MCVCVYIYIYIYSPRPVDSGFLIPWILTAWIGRTPSFQYKICVFLSPAPRKSCAGRCRQLRQKGCQGHPALA